MDRVLRKSENKIVSGVLGGLAEYFGINTTLLRATFVCAVCEPHIGGVSLVFYLVLHFLMENAVPAQQAAIADAPKEEAAADGKGETDAVAATKAPVAAAE